MLKILNQCLYNLNSISKEEYLIRDRLDTLRDNIIICLFLEDKLSNVISKIEGLPF